MVRLEAALLIACVALSAPLATAQTVRDPFADLLARRTPAPNQDLIDYNESAERARAYLREGRRDDGILILSPEDVRFRLFNDCEPVTVNGPYIWWEIGSDPGSTVRRGSTTWSIRTTAETRFRNAGVLGERGRRGGFGLEMSGSPTGFDATATFSKAVIDLASGEVGTAATWERATMFGGRGRSTPEAVASDLIDSFLTDYLAANEDACAERRAP